MALEQNFKNNKMDKIIFTIPFGYQFFEQAQKDMIYLRYVPFDELVMFVVSSYIACLYRDEWPGDYYGEKIDEFVFEEYLHGLSEIDHDPEALENELENAQNELSLLTEELHYHYCRKKHFVYEIFKQPAYYRVSRIRPFGVHRKHMEVWLELEAFEDK